MYVLGGSLTSFSIRKWLPQSTLLTQAPQIMNTSIAIAAFSKAHPKKQDYEPLISRNKSIVNTLLPKLPPKSYELVIFHDGGITLDHQKYIVTESGTKLKFIDVIKTAPMTGFDPHKELPSTISSTQEDDLFARHLSHFWFVDFLGYLKDYDYLIHIDENTTLLECPNPIAVMQNQNLKFLTAEQKNIDPYTMISLPEFCYFFRAGKLEPKIVLPPGLSGPRTNCMALDLNYFRELEVFSQFTRTIDIWGLIYTHAWNLRALWSVFLLLYLKPEENGITCRNWSFIDNDSGIIVNPLPEQLSNLNNIALNKTASVNLEYYPPNDRIESDAKNAVSGQFMGKYTFHTLYGDDPAWTLDLTEEQEIKAIQIYNRGDGQYQRALGMLVQISCDGENFETIHEQNEEFYGLQRAPLLIDFRLSNKVITARYLRLKIPRHECLHLDQVEVYA